MIRNYPVRALLGASLFFVLGASAMAGTERMPEETVLASRGDATITLRDVDAALLRIPPRQRADVMNSPKRIEELLSQLLLTRQLSNAGLKQGVEKDPLVQHAIHNAGEGVIGAQAVLVFRENVEVGNLDELARETYNADPSQFAIPATVTVRHILIDNVKQADSAALALAEEVHKRAATEDFESLVMQYSDDPSKTDNKGEIPDAASERMDPQFAEASGRLRTPGELAPLVKSQFGYHIIKLSNRVEPKLRTFDEVRVALTEELRTRKIEQQVKEYVDQMRSMAIEADPDAVASLRTRYIMAPPSVENPSKAPKSKSTKSAGK